MKTHSFYKFAILSLFFCHFSAMSAQNLDDQLIVNATISDVEGRAPKAVSEAKQMADIFVLQKQLVYKLLQNIGVRTDKLPAAVKAAIDQPQTTSVEAFNAFSNCLDLMDKKLYTKAREQCEAAITIDPNFVYAKTVFETIPIQNQSMQEIVVDHMGKMVAGGQQAATSSANDLSSNVANNIKADVIAVQIADLKNSPAACQGGNLGCDQIDPEISKPTCDSNGQCGFYSTFLTLSNSARSANDFNAPIMNRAAVSIPPTNSTGLVAINQIGYEGKGHLDVELQQNSAKIIEFKDGQSGQSNSNIVNAQLSRLPLSHQNEIKGLELGVYLPVNFGGGANSQENGLFHNFLYFAEGQVTPVDNIKSLGKVDYSGSVYGDFSVNGNLVPCQNSCGTFTSTLNYGAGKLEGFVINANAEQAKLVNGTNSVLTAAARIEVTNVDLKPSGEFHFDQSTPNSSFQAGINTNELQPANGLVAGRPFGSNGDSIGGVFAIHNDITQSAGNFGGNGNFK